MIELIDLIVFDLIVFGFDCIVSIGNDQNESASG